MYEAQQMTTAQAVGAASHTLGGFSTAVRIGSKPVSSRPYSFCIRPRPRFSRGRFWVLEPDDGKPSSPVLRGLGASNGARPLNSYSESEVPLCEVATSQPLACVVGLPDK